MNTILRCTLIASSIASSACGTLERPRWLENSVLCSLDQHTAKVASDWGLFAFAIPLRAADVPYICRPMATTAPAPLRIVPDVVLP